jgi:hypothetical protein
MLMSLDELVKTEFYRTKMSNARFRAQNIFPVPIIVLTDDTKTKS